MKTFFLNCSLLFSFFLFSSCKSTQRVYQLTKADSGDTNQIPELKRVFMAGGLEKEIIVSGINQGKANVDLLLIQVNLKNKTKSLLNLNYKVEWMDGNGLVISDSSSVWLPIVIRGSEVVTIKSVATTKNAQNFWLKLQRAKK